MEALLQTEVIQLQRKVWHDRNIKDKVFQEGDWALLYDSRFKDLKGILMTRWLGPYLIENFHENGFVQSKTIDEEGIPFLFNRYKFKSYKRPLSREEFISTISKEVNVIGRVSTSSSPNALRLFLFLFLKEKRKTIRGLVENLYEALEANSWVENLLEAF